MKEKLLRKIIKCLLDEQKYSIDVPNDYEILKRLYKSLVNIRQPKEISNEVLRTEDEYLQLELCDKIITDVDKLEYIEPNMILWQGDITTLKCDVIVNAGNNDGLGCFNPNHICIDNVIHTNAGMRLRLECNNILNGNKLNNGEIIVCNGYNLPCKKIITTVGPQVINEVTEEDEYELSKCYKNALEYAIKNNYKSIAFPSISTGLFSFPINKAKVIAYNSVREILNKYNSDIKVIFNVYSESDYNEYKKLFESKRDN
ncbi:MAG: macro domain-containing protein [Clostridia bacterium]|nr:macro domain-containing protein [Clostridia bacterium]